MKKQPFWRNDASAIVEQILSNCSAQDYDLLLELRSTLLNTDQLETVLDQFLEARQQLEGDHYFLFYRLRSLLVNSLALEIELTSDRVIQANLRTLLRHHFISLAHLRLSFTRLCPRADSAKIVQVRCVEV